MKTSPCRTLSQRLVLYGLSAGAVSVVPQAEAVIKYKGPDFSDDTIHFDIQNTTGPSTSFMSNDDFVMKSNCDKSKAKIKGKGSLCPAIGAAIRYGRPYAYRLSAGEPIGRQNFYTTAYFNDLNTDLNASTPNVASGVIGGGNDAGDWEPGDSGFLALRIIVNGNALYGWAEVTLNNLDCDGPVFTLHRYALNTDPNEIIFAGEIKLKKKKRGRDHLPSPTPCGSPTASIQSSGSTSASSLAPAAAIGLLIAGAAGVTTLKRRRNNSLSN